MQEHSSLNKKDRLLCKSILALHPIFSSLSDEHLEELILLFTKKIAPQNEIIVTQGDFIDSICFIAKGEAEVRHIIQGSQGNETVPIAALRKSESIGLSDVGFYSETGKRTATVVALSDVTLFCITLSKLNIFLNHHPELRLRFQGNAQLTLRMNFIREVIPFKDLPIEKLYWLAEEVTEVVVLPNTEIYRQNENATDCYLIQSGHVAILLQESDSTYHEIATLPSGSIFGETALLMQGKRPTTAKSLDECRLLVLNRQTLRTIMETDKQAEDALMNIVSSMHRPKHQEHVEIHSIPTPEGEELITLKDPVHSKYFRLTPEGWFIWQRCDGKHTVRDITLELYEQFEIFNPHLVSNLVTDLEHAGFIESYFLTNHQPSHAPSKWGWVRNLRKILEIKYVFENVDAWLAKTYERFVKVFYTYVGQIILILIALFGFVVFVTQFEENARLLKTESAGWLFLVTIPIIMVVMVFHELAHAYTTKAFGRKVRGMGIGWMWIGPIAYCDTSDMWLSPHWQRVAVDIAGVYLQMVLAGLAALLSLFLHTPWLILLLWYFSLFNYLTTFTNMTPIIKLDGYYTVMDILDVPNLREQTVKFVASNFRSNKRYRAEVIYLLTCSIYLIFDFIVSYIVLRHLLAGFFDITNPLISFLISLLIVFSSLFGFVKEVIATKKNT